MGLGMGAFAEKLGMEPLAHKPPLHVGLRCQYSIDLATCNCRAQFVKSEFACHADTPSFLCSGLCPVIFQRQRRNLVVLEPEG